MSAEKQRRREREDNSLFLTQVPYFSDYMTHQTIRRTQVLEEENRKKKF